MDVRYDETKNAAASMGDRSKSVPGLNIVSFLLWLNHTAVCLMGCLKHIALAWMQFSFLNGIFLQDEEEEEEDIDNLVSIHRRTVADGTNLRSSTVKYYVNC